MGDDDDYFHNEAEIPCIPDVPESLKSESDSMDLDELPCIVPEDLIVRNGPVEASGRGSDERQLPASQSQSSTSKRLAAAAASINRSEHLASTALQHLDLTNMCIRCQGDS